MQPIGSAVLHIEADVDEGYDDVMQWATDHHHPEAMTRPGWLRAMRFDAIDGPGGVAWECEPSLTIYELDDPEAARLADDHSYTPTPMPEGVAGVRSNRRLLEITWHSGGVEPRASQPAGDAPLLLQVFTTTPAPRTPVAQLGPAVLDVTHLSDAGAGAPGGGLATPGHLALYDLDPSIDHADIRGLVAHHERSSAAPVRAGLYRQTYPLAAAGGHPQTQGEP